MIAAPSSGNVLHAELGWCTDNGCFNPDRYPGDAAYLRWLSRRADRANRCAFVSAPDVVADAASTLRCSEPMLGKIRAAG
ncbi:hypothetical protein [Micromonospora sp. WMMD980]|uniref:hypothetical protein n=1 Tax=Micromonospora sp. WMMD980 TaxID=3016088 RepID=UPI002415F2D5|nr:hypothetical protein [Micromonospora sp. WMMD980]MDG4803680.1 hypothetical protein [Micromonospora sp. WMMD980]